MADTQTPQSSSLPSFDEYMAQPEAQQQQSAQAAAQSKLPTFDDYMKTTAQADEPSALMTTLRMFKPVPLFPNAQDLQEVHDNTKQFLTHTAVGRMMSAIGHGFSEGFGDEQVGLSPEAKQKLGEAGITNDYVHGQTSLLRSMNEAIILPSVAALDAAYRAAIRGTSGAYEEGALQFGEEIGSPAAGRDIANLPMALMNTGLGAQFEATRVPHTITDARVAGTIGEGEAGYFGTKTPTAAELDQRNLAVNNFYADQEALRNVTESAKATKEAPPPKGPPTIHDVAREAAPDTFREYDTLSQQRDTLGEWMRDMSSKREEEARANAPHNAEIAELEGKVADAQARGKETVYQDILDKKKEENEAWIQEQLGKDTNDIKNVREAYNKVDNRMRDLAPDVSAAYRTAQEQMPEHEVVPPTPAPEAPKEFEPTEGHFPEFKEGQNQPKFLPASTKITDDVSGKLVAAGRPKDEADAAAGLVAAHYEARAQRFNGERGTADEMYDRDGANIKAGNVKGKRGHLTLPANDAKATIKLMKSANASTFIHETGHHWLEELMNDAEDEKAPQQLMDDAKTVRDWLGNEGGDITTKQHEKFARGFERYMMEGTAPTGRLAKIFEQFKGWLSKIYSTVDKLKSPITDDIRDVFNRLISHGHNTVVAPDHEPGQMFGDLHTADVERTAPKDAATMRDQIRDEANQVAERLDPEVAHAINPTAEAGGVNAAPGGDQAVGAAAEPAAGETSSPAQPGTVGTSGDQAGAEGSAVRAEPKPAAGTATGPAGGDAGRSSRRYPDGPGSKFVPGKADFIDKAGNIRLDKINQPKDIDDILKDSAGRNDNFENYRRKGLTVGETLDLAALTGKDAAFLDAKKIGEAFSPEEIIRAKQMLVQSAQAVKEAMTDVANGGDVMKLAEVITRHDMIQAKVSQATAEWSHAGRALQVMLQGSGEAADLGAFLKENTGRTLNQLEEMAKFGAKLNTPEQMAKWLEASKKNSFGRMVIEYYVNCLISGPITHLRYSMGNALNALWTPLVEIPTAAAIGRARELITGVEDADRVHLGESLAQLHGMVNGSKEGLRAAIEAFKTNQSPLLPKERVPEAFLDTGGTGHEIPGKLGQVINIPSKSVSAIHSFFKSLRYEQNIQGLAYRQAFKEGLEGDAFTNRVSDLTHSPTDEMMESATADSLKELYMAPTEYSSLAGKLTRLANHNVMTKVLVPFMKIGTQITRNAFIERTPLGLVDSKVRSNLFYENGKPIGDMQAAKVATGVALMGTLAGMTAAGLATGDGPSDPNRRAVWLLNHKPNSIQIGDIRIPYQGLGHLGMLMRFAANMTETAQGWDEKNGSTLANSFMDGAVRSVLDDNWMRGVKDALDAVYHHEEYGAQYIRSFATNWLPFSVGMSQVAREIDPMHREAHTLFQEAEMKMPLLSENLPPKRDRFGTPIPNGGLLPQYQNDPVVQRMEALQFDFGKLERKIRGVPLNDQQFDDYSRVAGTTAKMRLNAVVATPGFSTLPEGTQIELMHNIISESREMARTLVMMQNPDIIQKATQAKKDAAFGKKSSQNAQ